MTNFRVSWDIDVELEEDSATEAAIEAHRLVTKPDTTANVYTVENKETGVVTTVDLTEGTAEPAPKHSITILWGSLPDPDREPVTYDFESAAELAAFRRGIDEMDGWMGYAIVEP